MLAECLALAVMGLSAPFHARWAGNIQLTASHLTGAMGSVVGAWVVWLIAALLLGRVYCAAFCPAGVIQDFTVSLTELVRRRRRKWRKRPARPMRWWVLGAYGVAVLSGVAVVPLLVEPWPAFTNMVQQASGHASDTWALAPKAGVGAVWGMACAIVSIILIVVYALVSGRDFCNDICPMGSILALASARSAMHIEFYPDRCTSCLKCEDVCRAGCIDIAARTIDNARCIRCFDCLAVCPDDALRYQLNPNGIITPMFRRARPEV